MISRHILRAMVCLVAAASTVGASRAVAQDRGAVDATTRRQTDVLALFSQVVAAEMDEYGRADRLVLDLKSFTLNAQSLLGHVVAEAPVRAAIGHAFSDVFWANWGRGNTAVADSSSVLHVRLDGLMTRGSVYTVLTTSTYTRNGDSELRQYLTVFVFRGGAWERLRRVNLGIT